MSVLAECERRWGTLAEPAARAALLVLSGGPGALRAAVRGAGSARAVLDGPQDRALVPAAREAALLARVAAVLEGAAAGAYALLCPGEPEWPEALDEAVRPPALLFVRGRLCGGSRRPGLALVGSRRRADYGRRVARRLADTWARLGGITVSGGALGVDGAAHEAALAAGGETVAVLGTGVDVPYPPRHRDLLARVAAQGALVSEHAPGTPARPGNFPERNRLIAALAALTVVVQARRGSGALYTATFALKSGRLLYTVPAPVDDEACAGGLELLTKGVPPLVFAEQLAGLYEQLSGTPVHPSALPLQPRQPPVVAADALEPATRQVLELLADGCIHVDDLAAHLNMGHAALSLLLLDLELRDWVRREAGNQFVSTVRLES